MNHVHGKSRNERRLMQKGLDRANQNWPAQLEAIPKEDWPKEGGQIAIFRSRDFLVQIFPATESIVRMSVNRTELRNDGRWSDEISWEELQRLKAEAGYGALDAVEIYPADQDVVNVANMRHLWILPDDLKLPFAWRAS